MEEMLQKIVLKLDRMDEDIQGIRSRMEHDLQGINVQIQGINGLAP
ncbi:hypothetical protein [Ammoniphilus sp. CFH 90114]|nr:hypothetical protein [Ammoniphilus sp. CFH 90114]